ncbi:MAG TPA: thiamine-phosphate kinase [Candidatus Dormibacteraeota bacterium]|nr:thiamine-phosphate kinase [Candidatus Dormibacteraeota bacterium]
MPRAIQNENSLIRRIVSGQKLKSRGLSLGIGDDAALFRPTPGYELILTCDWFLDGTHFLVDRHPPDSIGWKCLARAVSDVAAMGGTPKCFLLSVALPSRRTGSWLNGFLRGLHRAARSFHCPLAGGDTTERKEILINVTVIGEVRKDRALLRFGAKPGDLIYVSGRLGEAELGLKRIRQSGKAVAANSSFLRKQLYPEPRVKLGRWLAEKKLATAMMDLSDSLSSDLPRLCQASGVGAIVNAAQLRMLTRAKLPKGYIDNTRGSQDLHFALHGGDDYELLFTVARSKSRQVPASLDGIPLTAIGEITREKRVLLRDGQGKVGALRPHGWDPFRQHGRKK